MSSVLAADTKERSVAYFNQSLKLDLNQLGRERKQDYLKVAAGWYEDDQPGS